MNRFALLFLIWTALFGKAWSYGVPAISVGEDPELLTDTPIPIPHLTATPTMTATPLPTFTSTPTSVANGNNNEPSLFGENLAQSNHTPQLGTSAPTQTAIPTLVETITITSAGHMPSEADKPKPSPTVDPSGLNSFREQGFFEGSLGLDPVVQGSTGLETAAGIEAAIGILFKDGFAVQLDFEYFSQSNSNAAGTLSQSEVLVLPTLRRYLTAGSVRPYLLISHGLAINTATSGFTNSSTDSYDMALGGGVEFLLDHYFSTYVEGKYNFVFISGSPNQDIPLVIGARLGL